MARAELKADPGDRWGGRARPARHAPAKPAKGKAPRPRRRVGRFALRWGLAGAVWLVIAGVIALGWLAFDLPETAGLAGPMRGPSIVVTSADGAVIERIGAIVGRPLGFDEIDTDLVAAVLATEDRRFFEHEGIDFRGLARALVVNLSAGRIVQGGSTITQQLAKNLFLGPERTLARKLREAVLALWLERTFTKRELLAIYLNRVYFGGGAYGVEAAAQRYFSRSASDLDVSQAAMLAGLLKAPSRYAPTTDLAGAQARAALVLDTMVDAGVLDAEVAAAARTQPAMLRTPPSTGAGGRYFADWVLDDLDGYVGPGAGDVVVVTTLDAGIQAIAEQAVAEEIAASGAAQRFGQAAVVVLAPDGAVLAMVGGRDYQASQFNRVTQALRQPGSAFKPFVFLAGLEAGYRPTSRFTDAPIRIAGFAPRNYEAKYFGEVTLAEALARSLNSVAAQLAAKAGIDRVIEAARRLGVTTPLRRDLSLALGSSEVTLMELTAAYGALVNQGRAVLPYGITEVRDPRGTVLYARAGSGAGSVIDAHVRADLIGMLAGVVTFGTGAAAALPWPVAGKTGTSEDHRDAWFVGFTHDAIAGVWVGNDDNSAMRKVTGGGAPARIFARVMTGAMAGKAARPLLDEPAPAEDFDDLMGGLLATLGLAGDDSAPIDADVAPGDGQDLSRTDATER